MKNNTDKPKPLLKSKEIPKTSSTEAIQSPEPANTHSPLYSWFPVCLFITEVNFRRIMPQNVPQSRGPQHTEHHHTVSEGFTPHLIRRHQGCSYRGTSGHFRRLQGSAPPVPQPSLLCPPVHAQHLCALCSPG